MNLFIVGWNLSEKWYSRVLAELQRMTEIYPQLDPSTIWHRSSVSGMVLTASMHTNNLAAAPRRYVTHGDNEVVFYSGLPVNSTGNYLAHQAEDLSSHWNQITENLEGMYCIVRTTDQPSRLELLTDIIGVEQVYYFHNEGRWIISNSVCLIDRIIGHVALDPLGISLFLSVGWAGDDRTLKSNIRVIPGGQYWTWSEGRNEPERQSYYSSSKLARLPKKRLTKDYYELLSEDLIQIMRSLNLSFDNITCALTGGHDTRLLSSLLIHAGLKAQYYTFGELFGADGKIAKQLAQICGLSYKFIHFDTPDILYNWDKICRQIIQQGDGMAPADLITSVLFNLNLRFNRLPIDLGGTGGDLARRGLYSTYDLFLNKYGVADMQDYMVKKVISDYDGLINKEGIELARDCVCHFVSQYTDEGFHPIDIPHAFFLYSRVRRKRGSNKRVQMQYQDFFTPFFSRPFLEAVFSISTLQRHSAPIHYNLVKILSPEMHALSLDTGPWRSQRPVLELTKYYGKRMLRRILRQVSGIFVNASESKKISKKFHTSTDMFDKESWFKAKRAQLREFCLDQTESMIWHFVNRSLFESITLATTAPSGTSRQGVNIDLFFRIATLFSYERSNHSCNDSTHFC